MDRLTADDLATLMSLQDEWCISLYMPVSRKGPEASGNQTRFKNLLRRAQDRLQERGLREDRARARLEPAWQFLADHDWRDHSADGLAVFLCENKLLNYHLPLSFEEIAKVQRGFHLRPLWPLFTVDGRFYILALSQKHVRLLLGTRQSIAEIPLDGVPQGLDEIRRLYTVEEQLQSHAGARGGRGKESAVFHGGHGVGSDIREDQARELFRLVDQGVREALREEHSAPLVLAGVESVVSHYRHANTYSHLADPVVAGNPEPLSNEELHRRAWEIVEPIFAQGHQRALEQWALAACRNQTRQHLDEVLPAAVGGQVAVLFVPLNSEIWGAYDAATTRVELHETPRPGDADLLDVLTVETFAKGGSVYALPPEDLPARPVAAILRY